MSKEQIKNLVELKNIFPKANIYSLQKLEYKNYLPIKTLQEKTDVYRQTLEIKKGFPADDIIVQIFLFEISLDAAKQKVAALRSSKMLREMAVEVNLDKNSLNLLLNIYATVASPVLFEDKVRTCPQTDKSTIHTLLEENLPLKEEYQQICTKNADDIKEIYQNKKISQKFCAELLDIYAQEGAIKFKNLFQETIKKIEEFDSNFKQKEELATKILLSDLTLQDAKNIISFAREIPYDLLLEDLQIITLRYYPQKTFAEVSQVLEGLLKRFPYVEEPLENLSFATSVLRDGRPSAFTTASTQAVERQNKINYMRKLAEVPFFEEYQDELTLKFFSRKTPKELALIFKDILQRLPHIKSYKENADIAIKILLGKLPFDDAIEQAKYRVETRAVIGVDSLEFEALESYKGTDSKENIIAFFRNNLKDYPLIKGNHSLYYIALACLVDELNGKHPPQITKVTLELLQLGVPEKNVENIITKLSEKTEFDVYSLINAYQKFFQISKDHQDASARILNMLE